MIEIDDIVDRDSLKAWLTDWPRENGLDAVAARSLAVSIAHRAAMRVLPVWWGWTFTTVARERDLAALPELRCVLVSGVVGTMPTPETKRAAAFAAAASDSASDFADFAAAAASAAAAADFADFAAAAASDSAASDFAAAADFAAAWKSITEDCRVLAIGDQLDAVPLWSDGNPFDRDWLNLRAKLPEDWQFWRDWYQAALEGTPPNWKKLEQIALIDNEIWDAGPAAVNEEIARIEIDFAVAATPNAEEIRINRAGKYQVVVRSGLPARTLQDVNDRIGDTIRRIRAAQANNQYAALLAEADILQDIQSRYGDNPLRLYEVCLQVVRHVGVHVANGVLPENDNLIGDISGDLQNNSDDIYNFDGEARKTIDARAKLRFGRLDDGEKQRIIDLTEAVANHAVNALAQELREDAQAIAQEIEPSEETSANRYRLGSRLARIFVLGGKMLEDVTGALVFVGGVGSGAAIFWQIIRALLGF